MDAWGGAFVPLSGMDHTTKLPEQLSPERMQESFPRGLINDYTHIALMRLPWHRKHVAHFICIHVKV